VDAVNESGQCTYCLAREADRTLTARAAAEPETEPAEDVAEAPLSPKRRKSRKRGKA
jgi:hypothetical protein